MENSQQNPLLVPLAIVVAGALVAGAIYWGDTRQPDPSTSSGQATDTNIEIAPVTERDHILGSRDAKLIIVEYSDTECPFCKDFHAMMKEVTRTYSGQVAWVYRHFPIVTLHTKAPKESEATECAYELGGHQAFWKYIDRLFEVTNSNDSLDLAELPKIAAYIGLDTSAFNSCLSSDKYKEFISKSVEEALNAGARGTPYSIIVSKDGKKTLINGLEPIAMIKTKIDTLLK